MHTQEILQISQNSKLLGNNFNKSAVPKPSRTNFNTHSIERESSKQGNLSQDFKLVSKGINFEVKPFNPMLNQETSKSCLNNKRKTYNQFLNSKLKLNSRATTSEIHKRIKKTDSQGSVPKNRSRKDFEIRNRSKSRERKNVLVSNNKSTAYGK